MTSMNEQIILLYGGASTEHEVSVQSAAHAANEYPGKVIPVAITRDHHWYLQDEITANIDCSREVSVRPAKGLYAGEHLLEGSCILPLTHGTFGEDGSLQGLLALLPYPVASVSVEASAVGMSKYLTKLLCSSLDIPTVYYHVLHDNEPCSELQGITFPCFVKPDRGGSSVGITQVKSPESLQDGVSHALRYDHRVLVEESADAVELQIGWICEGDRIRYSAVGEIAAAEGFHSYETKYINDSGIQTEIPAKLDRDIMMRLLEYTTRMLKALDYPLYGRMDFFYSRSSGQLMLNELNTIPGMTPSSIFPKLFMHQGLNLGQVISLVVSAAQETFQSTSKLIRTLSSEHQL